MKNSIHDLMQKNNIDALLVTGAGQYNPNMVYLTGGGHVTNSDLILKRGHDGILYHNSMERDEAAKSGLTTKSYDRFSYEVLRKLSAGNPLDIAAYRYIQMFEDAGVTEGNIAIYGVTDISQKFAVLSRVQTLAPKLNFVGFLSDPILMTAMMTKDPAEIERIRNMGKITTTVVARVADFLTSHPVVNETLLKTDGQPLTIGDVKSKINLWLAELGAANPEDTIFAIGRDAGVPHSQGNPSDLMQLGKTIVFDIFPCEIGGGYFYDFTRTWCLGYAPAKIKEQYQQVKQVYDTVVSELKVDQPFKNSQKRTCQLFEELGHPTIQSTPGTEKGYVHSVGHGLGLNVHEMPFSGVAAGAEEVLAKGAVFTIEPGLYYPEDGFGIRIEDTYYVSEDGQIEILVPYPYDLVLPMKSH
jgi:Xaa-Pro aminopeptidase